MTIIGCKRDENQPRRPPKRSQLKRKTPFKRPHSSLKARTGSQTGQDEAYDEFMLKWRGEPSIMSGRTTSEFLRDEKGKLKTEAHHILPRSIFPEYKMCYWNIAVLTREEHSWAEDNPVAFMNWLHDGRPIIWKIVQEHNHHRRDS